MSSSPANPYDPNPYGDAQGAAAYRLPPTRPGGLTAICVIAIVLGVMGCGSSVLKGVNAFAGKYFQDMVSSMGGQPNNEMAKAQQEMNEAIWEVNNRYTIPTLVLAAAQFFVGIAIVVGGIRTLGLKAAGRKLLLMACCFILLYEIAQFIMMLFQTMQMMPIMEVHMSRMMEATPGNNPSAQEFGKTMAKFSLIGGMIFQGGWLLIKFVFFGIAIWYLGRPRIVELCQPPAITAKAIETT